MSLESTQLQIKECAHILIKQFQRIHDIKLEQFHRSFLISLHDGFIKIREDKRSWIERLWVWDHI